MASVEPLTTGGLNGAVFAGAVFGVVLGAPFSGSLAMLWVTRICKAVCDSGLYCARLEGRLETHATANPHNRET